MKKILLLIMGMAMAAGLTSCEKYTPQNRQESASAWNKSGTGVLLSCKIPEEMKAKMTPEALNGKTFVTAFYIQGDSLTINLNISEMKRGELDDTTTVGAVTSLSAIKADSDDGEGEKRILVDIETLNHFVKIEEETTRLFKEYLEAQKEAERAANGATDVDTTKVALMEKFNNKMVGASMGVAMLFNPRIDD